VAFDQASSVKAEFQGQRHRSLRFAAPPTRHP
jgi:hypothetical protein